MVSISFPPCILHPSISPSRSACGAGNGDILSTGGGGAGAYTLGAVR